MSSKAKLNEWCLVRKARANYSVGQLPNTQLFLCVLDVLTTDGNMHTFTPLKGNTKKKLAENDAAQLALDALLQTKNEKEEYAMILQAISDAIKNPCRNANTAVIELLLEAFELSDGWINAVNNNNNNYYSNHNLQLLNRNISLYFKGSGQPLQEQNKQLEGIILFA